MSCRGLAVLCALLLGTGACFGDRFDAVSRTDGAVGDGGTHDAAVPDGREDGNDASPDENDASPDENDASPDQTMADGTAADASASDSPDTGILIDGTSLDRTADDVLEDGVPSDAVSLDVVDMPWCAGKRIAFCADFDRVTAWSDGWTTTNVTPGSVLDFNLVDFTSPRRSLHATIPASGGTETASARLTKVVSTPLSRTVLDFDCNVANIGAGSGEWLLQTARLGRNGRESGVALLAQDTGRWGVFIATDIPILYAQLPAPPPYGRFVHVTLDVIWSATAGSVSILFDGVTVYTKTAIATALATTTSAVEVDVGFVEAAGATPQAEMSIDNVALQLR